MKTFFKYKFLLENKQKILRVAIITTLILAALFLFLFRTGDPDGKEIMKQNNSDTQTTVQTEISDEVIIVDVAGEVQNPAVIELPVESRINDAIEAAGGLTNQSDISQINRAAILADGDKIYIPAKPIILTEDSQTIGNNSIPNSATETDSSHQQLININYATASELEKVPGIGPATSAKIIQYRQVHGLFRKLEDIKKVSGIGEKTYEKMKAFISI